MSATKRTPRSASTLKNALRTTGPKTEAGKARARANALKHGLTAAGLALPGEDQAGIEQRFAAIQGELMPQTVLGSFFAHQIALHTVRCQRSARHESALLTIRIEEAVAGFDKARQAQAAKLFGWLPNNPSRYHSLLLATPEGVDLLVGGLQRLQADLARTRFLWDGDHAQELDALFGTTSKDQPASPERKISDAVLGNFAGIMPAALEHLTTDRERQVWARDRLIEHIQGEVDQLGAHRATLDLATIERDRNLVASHAVFDATREATEARKYEAASTRAIHRSLREFLVVEANPAPAPEAIPAPEMTPEPTVVADEPMQSKSIPIQHLQPSLASFEQPVRPAPTPAPKPPVLPVLAAVPTSAPRESTLRWFESALNHPGDVLSFSVGRT